MISAELVLLGVVGVVVLWALCAERLSRTLITLPMIFTGVGYLVSLRVGELADTHLLNEIARIVAEITLIIVLFADASHVQFREFSRHYVIPLRMLLIGMPLTILAGMLTVYLITPSGSWAVALLTAAILTPTDAALGASVVGAKGLPKRLTQSINVESGLNDGLALPFVVFGAISAGMMTHGAGVNEVVQTAALQVALGLIAGIAMGWVVAQAMNWAQIARWANEGSEAIVFLATAFATYLFADLIGGNGFIAVFVAGMVFGNTYKHDLRFIVEFMEGQGQLVTIAAFLIFGAVLLPAGLSHISLVALIVASLFLTFVRMIPIMISLIGSETSFKERLFLGWFGPRGLASILFALIVIDEYDIPYESELQACVVMTVFASIILHGVSAAPLARYFSKGSNKG